VSPEDASLRTKGIAASMISIGIACFLWRALGFSRSDCELLPELGARRGRPERTVVVSSPLMAIAWFLWRGPVPARSGDARGLLVSPMARPELGERSDGPERGTPATASMRTKKETKRGRKSDNGMSIGHKYEKRKQEKLKPKRRNHAHAQYHYQRCEL